MPEKEAPLHEKWEGQNFKTLELEIDKEIDSLFVPARMTDEHATAGAGPGQESPPHEVEPSGGSAPPLNLDAVHVEIDREIDKLFVPSQHSASLAGSSASPETLDPSAGISALIEQFNAAYLSLDWDFSRENLKKFVDALDQLQPMASRSSDAKSIFKILQVILKRLVQRPHAVNTQLVQLIRDSQGLLAHLLLIQGESGPHEKRRLKELMEKFQDLRQKALAAKAVGTFVPSRASRDYPFVGVPLEPASQPDRSGDEAPFEAEKQQSTPAIAPAPGLRERTGAQQRRVRHADACLLVCQGKWLALPASFVVKATRSTSKIRRKVLKRGYATLSDFKPFFSRAISGVRGEWDKLDSRELGSYRFEPLWFDPCDRSSVTGAIAVLTSDGQTHRIIFCEAANFIHDAEIAEDFSAKESLCCKTQSRVLVPFFELRGLMSSLPGSSSIEEKD